MRLAVVLALVPAALHAQSERAVFLVRHAQDTLAVETVSHDGSRFDAALRLRNPIVTLGQQVALNDSSMVRQIVTTVSAGARGDSLVQRGVLTISGDSALSHVEDARLAAREGDRWIRVPAGAVPFVNLSGLSVELMLRRARAMGGDTARIPVLLVGGQSAVATVVRNGADSVTIVLGIATLRARTDAAGRFLGAVVPSQDVVFERLPGNSPVATWRPDVVSHAAPAGASYVAEDVTLRTTAGLTLAGTLTMPRHAAGQRVPAVVMITGSGPQDRDEGSPSLPRWRPFRDVADTLSRRGIAVLRLDDRGVGGSDAGPATAT